MVYEQCGPVCPRTCNNYRRPECIGGCVDGCFCPSGQVLHSGQCIDRANCSGTVVILSYILFYIHLSNPTHILSFIS